jgi:hypothetical protein
MEASWRRTHEKVRHQEREARGRDREIDRLADGHVAKDDGSLGWSISLEGSKVGGGGM